MKLKWNKKPPEEPGFYMAWNPYEEDYPHVLRYDIIGNNTGWWTYPMNKIVVEETWSELSEALLRGFFQEMKRNAKAQEKKVIEKLESCLSDYEENRLENDDAFNLSSFIEQSCNDKTTCVFDVGAPQYWAKIPYLPEIDNEASDNAFSGGDPTQLDVEIEDIKAATINKIADEVSSVLSLRMGDFTSPWEKERPPWYKD